MTEEQWRDIKGFEGYYQVSDQGRVKSLDRTIVYSDGGKRIYPSKVRTPVVSHGYLRVNLSVNNKAKMPRIHRLVAEAFIDNPNNLPEVNHKNGIKTDNRVENLEWCTSSSNTIHAYKSGLQKGPQGERQGNSKLKEHQVIEIIRLRQSGNTQQSIADTFKIRREHVRDICNGKRWKHLQDRGATQNKYKLYSGKMPSYHTTETTQTE